MPLFDGNLDGVLHSDIELHPDPGRTIVLPFAPGDPENYVQERPRPQRIADRVHSLAESQVRYALNILILAADNRPRNFSQYLLERFDEVNGKLIEYCSVSDERKKLIAAYFCVEYSFQAAALFNPSIILNPWAVNQPDDGISFIMSLRAVGEGHVSSVTFRTGTWRSSTGFEIDPSSHRSIIPRIETDPTDSSITRLICEDGGDLSEVVIFPSTPTQQKGIEDMRLVSFANADGEADIYGTYTAYDGRNARSEIMQTRDFVNFTVQPLKGRFATSKGMALFPRKVGGRYMMLSRQDMENLWLLESDNLYEWNEGRKIIGPAYPWEFVQLGNCGSPIEIDEGWLVISHGVGVVRSYAVGAFLLDKNDPSIVLGRLRHPFLRPLGARAGYVPNVIYSCGSLVHDRTLLIPYAVADTFTRFASVPLDTLLGAMR